MTDAWHTVSDPWSLSIQELRAQARYHYDLALQACGRCNRCGREPEEIEEQCPLCNDVVAQQAA